MEEQRIVIADCCMKQQVKKFLDFLAQKPLTENELRLLCVYQFVMHLFIDFNIMYFQLAYRGADWLLADLVSRHFIIVTAIFVDTLLLIQMIENTKDIIHAWRCKCDQTQDS